MKRWFSQMITLPFNRYKMSLIDCSGVTSREMRQFHVSGSDRPYCNFSLHLTSFFDRKISILVSFFLNRRLPLFMRVRKIAKSDS